MGLCCREMIVHRYHGSGLHESHCKDILSRPALMCRKKILGAEDFLKFVRQPCECGRACIAVIGNHHRSQLSVAHGIHSAVCEHIKINVFVFEQKGVVTCFSHGSGPLFDRHKIKLLHNPDLVKL